MFEDQYLNRKLEIILNSVKHKYAVSSIYPTPPLGQDMTQGQFLSGV